MWTIKYIASVGLITIALLAIAATLWSKDGMSLTPGAESDSGFWRGTTDAPITIDVYPDFTCEICVEKERLALQAIDIYPTDVKMVYHPYPDSEFSWKLAEALEAAAEQGKFWELHDRFLAGVPGDISELKACARQTGLDIDRFEEALDTGIFRERVELGKQEAVSRGVTQVAIFVNGTEYQYSPGTIGDLRSTIDRELERLGK